MPAPLAPLNPEEVRAVLTAEYGAARTLPAEAYFSEDVLDWERRNIFDGSWVCVGRSDLVDGPHKQRAIQVGTESIVLARDANGSLQGTTTPVGTAATSCSASANA